MTGPAIRPAAAGRPLVAEGRQLDRTVALGQATPVGADGQRDVAELGRGPAEAPVEQELSRGARHQVVAPDHLRDAHGRVVVHDGQLVGGGMPRSGDDEVSAEPSRVELDGAEEEVSPGDPPGRDPEPPCERAVAQVAGIGHGPARAGPGVDGTFVLRVGRRRGPLDVGPRAGARVDSLRPLQALQRLGIRIEPERLDVRGRRAADVGAFVPVEPQPFQVGARTGLRPGPGPRGVEVLDPQDHPAPGAPGGEPGDQEGPGMPQVQPPRRRGGQSPDDRRVGSGLATLGQSSPKARAGVMFV